MRHHLQGAILLAAAVAALWGTTKLAAPVVSDALKGEDGALVAESPEDVVELSAAVTAGDDVTSTVVAAPLTAQEIVELQSLLADAGYDPGGFDGILGPRTRAAMAEASEALSLPPGSSDRALLERLLQPIADPPTVPDDLADFTG